MLKYQKYTFYNDTFTLIPQLYKKYSLAVVSDAWPSLENVFVTANLRKYFTSFSKFDFGAKERANRTKKILKDLCNDYELNEIISIIEVHDDRYSDRYVLSEYIKIHQDADHLDHFGVFDIWTEFLHAVHHKRTVIDVIEWFKDVRPTWDEKFRRELNYDISRKIFDEKCSFVHEFGKRLAVELNGKYGRQKSYWDKYMSLQSWFALVFAGRAST